MQKINPFHFKAGIPTLLGCLFSLISLAHAAGPFFVSPTGDDTNDGKSPNQAWKTLQKARDVIRTGKFNVNMQMDLVVYLDGGIYPVSTPIVFDNRDGGSNDHDVVYRALPGQSPKLDGGTRIKDWVIYDNAKGIWKAVLPNPVETRQFYVNGVRAIRARSIRGLDSANYDNVYAKTIDTSMVHWKNQSNLEMVYHGIFASARCGVDTITRTGDTAYLKMKQPGYSWCRNKGISSAGKPWYAENAYELLDVAGEWYLDKSGAIGGTPYTLYYKPRTGESMLTAEAVLPVAEQLLLVKGTSVDQLVQHMRFEGLTFQYNTWNQPSTNLAHPDAQNNIIRRKTGAPGVIGEHVVPGAVEISWAHKVIFTGNTLQHIGSTGFVALDACQQILLDRNLVTDISGTGIHFGKVDRADTNNYLPKDPRYLLQFNKVTNNTVTWVGVEYRSATGIAAAYPVHMEISHNEVGYSNYSGIHIGWGWVLGPNCTRNNQIINNYVHDTMRQLYDGANIYTLGMTSGSADSTSLIAYNYLKNSHGGVYNDEASEFYKIQSNVGTYTGQYVLWQQNTAPLAPHDNQADSFMVNQTGFVNNGIKCSITNTITIPASYATMPARAQQIIDQAGPTDILVTASNPPSELAISNTTIASKASANTFVGVLSAKDPDLTEFVSYSLVTGTGSSDNALFKISRDSLYTNAVMTNSTSLTRMIRLRATDLKGLWVEKSFTLTLKEPPVYLRLKPRGTLITGTSDTFDLLGRNISFIQ